MSELLPIFPLPNVVLFPGVFLPLHIFEPRYREMVADALSSDRMIGMVLLRPGWQHEYEGRPPVYLGVMRRDAATARGDRPSVLISLTDDPSAGPVKTWVRDQLRVAQAV